MCGGQSSGNFLQNQFGKRVISLNFFHAIVKWRVGFHKKLDIWIGQSLIMEVGKIVKCFAAIKFNLKRKFNLEIYSAARRFDYTNEIGN